MRRDMFKVIVERPRRGGWSDIKGRSHEIDFEEAPTQEKIRPTGPGASRKYLNENLAPLKRFLRSKLGKSWDDIYSEVREHLSPNSAVQQHVIDHLKQYVIVDTCIQNGVVGHIPEYYSYGLSGGFESLEEPNYFRDQFYVHPKTKVLCVCKHKKRSYKSKPTHEVIQVDGYHQYRKIDNIWYSVTLEDVSVWEEAHKGFLYGGPPDCIFDQKKSIWDRRPMS